MRDYLFRTLRGPFETIVGYSIDQGFTFAEPSMRAVFEQRLGVVQQEGAEQPAPGNDPPLSVAPLDALWMLLRFLRVSPPQSACVIVERFELIAPAVSLDQAADPRLALLGLLKDAGTDAALDTRGNPLILLASSLEGVNAYVRDGSSGIMAIEVPLPDYDARLAFISQRLADEDDVALDGIEPAQLAALTAGLYRRHIENVFLRARSRGGKLTRDLARQVQKELMDLEYSEIMQRVETTFTLEDVGGHVEAKRYFEQRVVKPMRDGKTQRVPSNVLLAGPPGCLAASTMLGINRAGKGYQTSIADVVRGFNGLPNNGHRWNLDIPTYVQRAEEDGTVRLAQVLAAWESGVKQTYRIVTTAGRSIRATSQHPFMTSTGWRQLEDLHVGDTLLVKIGRSAQGKAPKKRYASTYTRFHPYQRAAKDGFRHTTHRLVAEAELNGLSMSDFISILRTDAARAATLNYLPPSQPVHHVNGNHRDNALTNLQPLQNQQEHAAEHNWTGNVLEHIGNDTIVSIEAFGREMTYDIEVADDPHCFLANEFVVHNTGKTLLASAVANDSGLNCLYVDLAKLLGGIVGQTEQNFAKFKRGVLANAPCILILDEVDQKVRRGEGGADGGGGGAVENRLFSAVLEFFGDPTNKGRIMGLFLSNRPKLLDPAFMSRMQAIIPILPAESDDARADVLGRILRRQGSALESWQLQALASRIVDWSGRDLDQTVDEALAIRDLEGMDTLKALEEAIADRRPSTHDVRQQVNDALRACNNLRLLPEKYRRMAEQVSPAQNTPNADDEPGARRQRRSLDIDNN